MFVLLVFEYPTLNGGENSLLSILDGLQEKGYRFEAIVPGGSDLARSLELANVTIHPYPDNDLTGAEAKRAKRDFIADTIATVRPDLVHANSLSMARMVGPIAKSQGCPSVGHIRDIIKLNRKAILDLGDNDCLIAVSNATRQIMVDQGIPSSKIVTIYNGIDIVRFKPRPAMGFLHDELGISRATKLVVSIGQIGLRKATDAFLRVASLAVNEHDCAFLIIGERNSHKQESFDFERQLHAMAGCLPLQGRVFFLGRRTDVHHILNEATVLMHLAKQEPLGRVLLEAGASGCCVVATNVGGTAEVFPPECNTAQLVPVGDDQSAVEALRRLLKDATLRIKQASNGRNRIKTVFSVSKCVDRTAEVFRRGM